MELGNWFELPTPTLLSQPPYKGGALNATSCERGHLVGSRRMIFDIGPNRQQFHRMLHLKSENCNCKLQLQD